MAYRRRSSSRRSYGRRRTTSYRRGSSSRVRRGRSGGGRAVRVELVINNGAGVSRPPIGMKPAPAAKKAAF